MVSKTRNMRVVLMGTFTVVPEVTNVIIIFFFITFMYATVGLSLFMEEFHYCTDGRASDRDSCQGFVEHESDAGTYLVPTVWTLPDQNFENILDALMTLSVRMFVCRELGQCAVFWHRCCWSRLAAN